MGWTITTDVYATLSNYLYREVKYMQHTNNLLQLSYD